LANFKEATAVIRQGDKEAGKEILLDILQDDPENDMAWVWMSAVMDTDDLRLECLEEALRFNPDNQMAQRGIAKLRKKGAGETAVSPQYASPATKPSSSVAATLTYLCRRLIIEKQYQFAENLFARNPIIDSIVFDEPQKLRVEPIVAFPELNPLFPYFDAVLFRIGGNGLNVICIKIRDAQKIKNNFISQDRLVEIGKGYLKSNHLRMGFEVWELFEREFTSEDEARLSALKRIPGFKGVMITSLAIDVFSRQVKKCYQPSLATIFNAAYPKRINRWLKEESTFSEEETFQTIANGGVKFGSILLGLMGGIALALVIDFFLMWIQWPSGWIVDMIGAITAIMIAIYSRKAKVDNKYQGIITAALFGIVYYVILLFLFDYWLGLIWIWNIGWMIVWGAFLGRVTDP